MSGWTREQAIESLRMCEAGKHWMTGGTCDSCWVDRHRCPPVPKDAARALTEAVALGERARRLQQRCKALFEEERFQ